VISYLFLVFDFSPRAFKRSEDGGFAILTFHFSLNTFHFSFLIGVCHYLITP